MKWIALTLAFVIGGCAGCASIPAPRPEFAAAVRLDFLDGGNCSGTAVSEFAIVSAAHCFKASDFGAMSIDGKPSAFQVIANDGRDHVLLRVTVRQANTARIGKAPVWGEPLALIGNPVGLSRLFRAGRVAAIDNGFSCLGSSEVCPALLIDLNTAGGDSGAGYFNVKGELVGVHSASYSYGIFKMAVSYKWAFSPEQWKAAGV